MNLKIEEIKKLESPPKVIKNIFDMNEISEFLELYQKLPITVHNKRRDGYKDIVKN